MSLPAPAAIVRRFLTDLLALNLFAMWAYFWGMAVRQHYLMGDLLAAVLTVLITIVPAIALLGWHLSGVIAGPGVVRSGVERLAPG